MVNQELLTKDYFQKIISYDLVLKQNYKSIMQLPNLEKIVLNTTSKAYVNDKKNILPALAALELISGQKSTVTYARKSIANFKIRENQIIGCKVVLSKKKMYLFLDKLCKMIFPRIRDSVPPQLKSDSRDSLRKQSGKSRETLTFGFQNLMLFPELENHYELVEHFQGMSCSFTLSKSNARTKVLLLSAFQIPISLKA